MKPGILMVMLAIAGVRAAFAQQIITNFPMSNQNQTDIIFNNPLPATSKIKFEFLLPVGNKMILEFNSVGQVDSLPDVDSLLNEVWRNLQRFENDLNIPLVNKRVDYYYTNPYDTKIRIQQYPQKGAIYRLKDNDIVQLKVEQDTLRIKLYTRKMGKIGNEDRLLNFSYFITFIINNISDITSVTKANLTGPAVSWLKKDLPGRTTTKRSKVIFSRYYALYDVVNQKRLSPSAGEIRGYNRKTTVSPYFQTGIQYIRGAWSPSIGVGVELRQSIVQSQQLHFRLMWEPYFFFGRNTAGKLTPGRNDFITFKFNYTSKISIPAREIQFVQNLSLSYLVARKGDWFEPGTIKFSLPGLQTKNILLEPEFVFNKFFRNFSPSMKFTLLFE